MATTETAPLILSIFVGTLGIDRMFIGKWGTGFLKLLTGGGLGVWWIIDIIIIAISINQRTPPRSGGVLCPGRSF
jgi:TM2 domain-containing membrane protein YozV